MNKMNKLKILQKWHNTINKTEAYRTGTFNNEEVVTFMTYPQCILMLFQRSTDDLRNSSSVNES